MGQIRFAYEDFYEVWQPEGVKAYWRVLLLDHYISESADEQIQEMVDAFVYPDDPETITTLKLTTRFDQESGKRLEMLSMIGQSLFNTFDVRPENLDEVKAGMLFVCLFDQDQIGISRKYIKHARENEKK